MVYVLFIILILIDLIFRSVKDAKKKTLKSTRESVRQNAEAREVRKREKLKLKYALSKANKRTAINNTFQSGSPSELFLLTVDISTLEVSKPAVAPIDMDCHLKCDETTDIAMAMGKLDVDVSDEDIENTEDESSTDLRYVKFSALCLLLVHTSWVVMLRLYTDTMVMLCIWL